MESRLKWFKHYSNASESETLETIIEKMGYEGYGMYWRLIELLSSNYDGESTQSSFRLSTIKRLLGIRVTTKLVQLSNIVTTKSPLSIHIDKDTVFFDAPILAKLKAKDFKRSRPSRDQVALEENRIDKNRIEESSARPCRAKPINYNSFSDTWNQTVGPMMPKVQALSPKRKSAIRTLVKNCPDLDFKKYVEKITTVPFLCGVNDRGWVAGFDWAINFSNYLKVVEGEYQSAKPVEQITEDDLGDF